MLNQSSRALSWLLALSLVAVACGDDDDTSDVATGGGGGKAGAANGGKAGSAGKAGSGGGVSGGSAGKGGGPSGGQTSGGAPIGGQSTGGAPEAGAGAGGEGGSPTGGSGPGSGGSPPEGGSAGTGGTPPEGGTGPGSSGSSGDGGWGGGSSGGAPVTGGSGGAGGWEDGGAGGEGGAPVVTIPLINPGFELGTDNQTPSQGWTTSGANPTASYTRHNASAARSGWGYLNQWASTAYTVETSQVVTSLPDGNYSLSVWQVGVAYADQYVFVRGHDRDNPTVEIKVNTTATVWNEYTERKISPIPVNSGQLTIGIYSRSTLTTTGGDWSQFDDFTLTRLP